MPHPQRPNGQAASSSSSKPLTPHPSLPVNPMTYQPPAPSISPMTSSPATSNYQYPNMPYAYAPTGVPIPAYPMYGQPQQQGMMMMVPQPQGHYNPTMALRQSLFQTPAYGYIPTSTAEGYSYSSTYIQQQQQQQQQKQKTLQPTQVQQSQQQAVPGPSTESDSRPAKRPRPNAVPTSSTSKPFHSTASTDTSTTSTTYLPIRTKLPLKKGQTEESSQGHWRNCSEPGCHYVGPDREVRVHEEDRHLYVKGQKRGAAATEGGQKGNEEEDGDEEEEERARRAISG
jgi:hypothetical protein